uniref:SFRICE_007210 n=1 Tax=Spodoptera frugiperda TaxID=7108 RepID=A0A2H1V1W0_SPOFR
MKRRYSRVHQILKNAGVIDSSSENESADSDIIENTPVVSPENCPEQAARSSNGATCGNAISTTITSEQVYEVGEISIEAPAFSPLTPKVIHHTKGTPNDIEPYLDNVYKEPFEVGETNIKAPAISQLSPMQASQLVIAERIVEGSDFLSPPLENFYVTENRTDYEQASPLSSPVPDMSPATTKVFNMLIGTEQDSDDSVVDPNYVTDSDNSTTDDESDARENS